MIPAIPRAQFEEQLALTEQYCPETIPKGWNKIQPPPGAQFVGQEWFRSPDGLLVCFTADNLQGDGKTWLHVSMSRQQKIPTYDDMAKVKRIFIGPERQAVQIFPMHDRHVNIHPYCLHLWCCIEGDGLPDFGRDGTI